jgi:pimeloyl-ACP methyl ester carboxylesterase
MPLFATYNAELEEHFLVVHWDQRGAGRSAAADIPPQSMRLKQFVADAVELIDWITDHYEQEKVYLLGHSWGSLVAAIVAAEHPERLHAYVGVGQLVAGLRNEQASFEFTLRRAVETHTTEAVEALRAIEHHYNGELTFADIVVQRGWLDRFGGTVHGDLGALFERVDPTLREEYFGPPSLAAQEFSFAHLLPDLLAADLVCTARTFDVPVHLMLGRHDQTTPAQLAATYFEEIEAPSKQLHWFEESGHMIPFEEPAKFNRLMVDCLR